MNTTLLQQAITLHQQGQISQAQAVYQEILKIQPRHFDSLHMLGVTYFQTGQLEKGVHLVAEALKIDPNSAEAHNNLGNALCDLKRLDEALASYDQALALRPEYVEAHKSRGNILLALKRPNEALVSYDRVLALRPEDIEAHCNRGNILRDLKRPDEALDSFDRVLALRSDIVEVYYNRGNTLRDLKRLDEALDSYDRALALRPEFIEAHLNRGNVLRDLKRFDEALDSDDRILALKPEFAEVHHNRGISLLYLNRPDEALTCCDRALALRPELAEAHNIRGSALLRLNRPDEALACFDRALVLRPEYVDAHNNRGGALLYLNRPDEALACFDRALALRPEDAGACFHKSLILLLTGDFKQGWRLYERRWLTKTWSPYKRSFTQPLWLGKESLEGKTILLHTEQGLGDALQFVRYAPLVSRLGARVILECDKSLIGIFEGLEGVSVVIENGQPLPTFDYQCPLLSLPLAFETRINTIPLPTSYLMSQPESLKRWSARLGEKTRPRIGLVWSGRTLHKNDLNRSLTLTQILRHLPPDNDYVSLQQEVREIDRIALEQRSIKHFGNELNDFADTAALCDLMDLVISIDTSVAHLSGALGKPTWVLLPYAPDWRWLLDREDSPWYSSVRLFRQPKRKDWESVLERIHDEILRKFGDATRATEINL